MRWRCWSLGAGTLTLALLAVPGGARDAEPPPDPTPPPGVEVQTRGPIHEAFAEPTDMRPLSTLVVPKQPPAPIDELPPEQRPAGDIVLWMPGYWGWDEDRADFVWVSGFWRVPPPRRQWVPGSWQKLANSWQWTAGFWALANQTEIEYLPAPPPSIDNGATTPPPDPTSIYTPGCWVFRDRRYLWRPGFWVDFKPDWVWIPAHYVWTPAGYVFVEGYWDRPLEQRGLLFAPLFIDRSVVAASWVYTPHYVVQTDFVIGALFVRPGHCHYYFGDFFEDRYRKIGFIPWVDFRVVRDTYDPNFAYYRQRFGGDRSWEINLRQLYVARTRGDVPRPPRTLAQQRTLIQNITVNKTVNVALSRNIRITNGQNVSVVTAITRVNNTRVTGLEVLSTARVQPARVESHVVRVETLPKEQVVAVQRSVTDYRQSAQVRHQTEAKLITEGNAPLKVTDAPKSVSVHLAKPIAVGRAEPGRDAPRAPVLPKHEERPIPGSPKP
jgi:hypothetical protein